MTPHPRSGCLKSLVVRINKRRKINLIKTNYWRTTGQLTMWLTVNDCFTVTGRSRVRRIHWRCFQVSYARAHLAKRNKFVSKRTLDYFRKKHPQYANNWLVSQIVVRAETVNVTAHLVGCNTEQFPSFFVNSFQWNQSTMRWSRVSKAYHFLKKIS